jgi:HemY protein
LIRAAERAGDKGQAAGLAAKAQALAPDVAAVAAHHARLLIGLGRGRTAAKAIERAWRTAPHPDLARLYLDLHPEAGALARVGAAQRLAAQNPEAEESRIAIAGAALGAQLWGEARRHLALAAASHEVSPGSSASKSSASGPSRRLCLLMARLEESEPGSGQAARDWLDRAIGAPPDPCYVCAQCGGETSEWLALCPECGGFDTLGWRSPPSASRLLPSLTGTQPSGAGASLMLLAREVPGDMRRVSLPELPPELPRGLARKGRVAPAAPRPLRRFLPWFRASGLAPPSRWDK